MKRRGHISETRSLTQLLRVGGHLTDPWLLLAVDGELSSSEASLVTSHLDTCWQCRIRKEEIGKVIAGIVEYEKRFASAVVKPPADSSMFFRLKLNQLALETSAVTVSAQGRFFRRLRSAISRPALLGAGMAAACCVLLVLSVRKPQTVSAAEILHLATSNEQIDLRNLNQPVIVQKLSVRVGSRNEVKTVYHDVMHRRDVQHVDMGSADDALDQQAFSQLTFDWNDPLSPRRYAEWWKGVAEKHDTVTSVDQDSTRIDTVAADGPIAEASFTVRAADYHPIAEVLHLRDDTRIEIAELSYSVVSLDTLARDVFPEDAPAEPPTITAASTHLITPRPAPGQMAASELAVMATLHGLGADLGEQISVQPDAQGLLNVVGIVESAARQQQIADALKQIPFTSVRVNSVDAVAATSAAADPAPVQPPASAVSVSEMAGPLLEEQLKARFPDNEQRSEFVDRALAISQDATAHTWALTRLGQQLDSKQVALLDVTGRRQLEAIAADHIAALRADVQELQSQIHPFLASGPLAELPLSGSSSDGGSTGDWRISASRLRSSAEAANESLGALLAGSATAQSKSADVERQLLLRTLTHFQSTLDQLDAQLSTSLGKGSNH